MRVGDEYVVRMAGAVGRAGARRREQPDASAWPRSRTTSRPARSSSARPREGDFVVFEIESWARVEHEGSSTLLYDKLRMAKEIQLHMWTSTLEGVVRVVGRQDDPRHRHPHAPGAAVNDRAAARALKDRPLNYDPDAPHDRADGWRVDDYCEPLPSEPPGAARAAAARSSAARPLLREYKVADPEMVRATYDPTRRWPGATCCSRSASARSACTRAPASATSPTRSAPRTAGPCASGAGPTRRSRATSSRAR